MRNRFDDMCKMRSEGKTINEIASHYGISKQRVSQLFREHNMPLRLDATNEEILSSVDNLETLANQYGIKTESLIARAKRLGVSFPRKQNKRYKWPKERVMEMYRDYEGGMTQAEIGAKYGIHQTQVSYAFAEYGLKTLFNKIGQYPRNNSRKIRF